MVLRLESELLKKKPLRPLWQLKGAVVNHNYCHPHLKIIEKSNNIFKISSKLVLVSKNIWTLRLRKKIWKFEAEGQEFAYILRLLKEFIRKAKGQNNSWNRILFWLITGSFYKYIEYIGTLKYQFRKYTTFNFSHTITCQRARNLK